RYDQLQVDYILFFSMASDFLHTVLFVGNPIAQQHLVTNRIIHLSFQRTPLHICYYLLMAIGMNRPCVTCTVLSSFDSFPRKGLYSTHSSSSISPCIDSSDCC